MKHSLRSIGICSIIFLLMVSACQVLELVESVFPLEIIGPSASSTPSMPLDGAGGAATPTPDDIFQNPNQLIVWMLPQFDPGAESPAGKFLSAQMSAFQEQFPEINLDIRIKAESGGGALLDTLVMSSMVAPASMPSVIVIPRSQMETAVSQGIITPIEKFSSEIDDSDWFPFAYDMGIYHGEAFGLPFAADVIGMVTQSVNLGSDYKTLREASGLLESIGIAAGDPDSLIPFIYYQSLGGVLTDTQEQPVLEPEEVERVLSEFEYLKKIGVLSASLVDVQTEDQLWKEFQAGGYDGIATWLSGSTSFPGSSLISPLIGVGGQAYTYADGWVWCLIEKENFDEEVAIVFMEHMVNSQFLSAWTVESGFLPVRPSSVAGFEGTLQTTLANIMLSAKLKPGEDVLSYSKIEFTNAMQEILKGFSTSEKSTREIFENLEEIQAE